MLSLHFSRPIRDCEGEGDRREDKTKVEDSFVGAVEGLYISTMGKTKDQ